MGKCIPQPTKPDHTNRAMSGVDWFISIARMSPRQCDLTLLFCFMALSYGLKGQTHSCRNAAFILSKSVAYHDPGDKWPETVLSVNLAEPRTETPFRHSVLHLDNALDSFAITRNRGTHFSTHIVNSDGVPTLLWDGKLLSKVEANHYQLDPRMNFGFKRFYRMMYGLPMSLDNEIKEVSREAREGDFGGRPCYVLDVELIRSLISQHWRLFISIETFELAGIEFYSKQDPAFGERLLFFDTLHNDGLRIPRSRHWYKLNNDYLGSDIIIVNKVY